MSLISAKFYTEIIRGKTTDSYSRKKWDQDTQVIKSQPKKKSDIILNCEMWCCRVWNTSVVTIESIEMTEIILFTAKVILQWGNCNLLQGNFQPPKVEYLHSKIWLGDNLRKQSPHNREPNLCCHLETLCRAASPAMNERVKVWTDRFKQLHPHEPCLIGVRANTVEPKNVLPSEENHSGLCYSVHKDVLWFIVTGAAWGPLNASFCLSTRCVVSSFDRDITFTNLELNVSVEIRPFSD